MKSWLYPAYNEIETAQTHYCNENLFGVFHLLAPNYKSRNLVYQYHNLKPLNVRNISGT